MLKITIRHLFIFTIFTVFAATRLFAQTITVGFNGALDPGPYAPGSNIAIPFYVDQAGVCINQNNRYELYMSDALGSFAGSTTPVATTAANTFYSTYINYTLPVSTTPGSYKFMVKATSPAVSSPASNAVIVAAGTPVAAGANADASINAEKFGQSSGPRSTYTFFDASTPTATTSTISIFNETTQTFNVQDQSIKTDYTFNATSTNFTVIAKATNGVVVSTRAYELINNVVNSSIAVQGNGTICLNNGVAPLTYSVSIAGNNRIQLNYPGNLYRFSWGDNGTDELTLCQILAANGDVTHQFTRASCNNPIAGHNNSFQVDITIRSTIGTAIGGTVTSYAVILQTPVNLITSASNVVCLNPVTNTTGLITFLNGSVASADPLNTSTPTCAPNPNARYIWLVDGQIKATNYTVGQDFQWAFTTSGAHTVTLREQVGNGGACQAIDYTYNICVQKPAVADFTIPAGPICRSTIVTPTNTSVLDAVNCAPSTYNWTVNSPNYVLRGGTTLNSPQPQFEFTQAGFYTLSLNITTQAPGGCTSNTVTKTIIVDATPTATLQGDLSLCAAQTINFNSTRVTFTGTTAQSYAANPTTTYTWTVTGPGNPSYSFAPGSDLHSQYPQIIFNDYATYTITVTHTNSCGTATDSQDITFQPAPSVNAGNDQTICQAPGVVVNLSGTITGTYDTSVWTVVAGSNGASLTTPNNSLTASYTPNAADYTRGFVTFRLTATTNALPPPCNNVTDEVIITLVQTTVVTSPNSKSICSNDNVAYDIMSNNIGTTYIWTSNVTVGSVTITPNSTASRINDRLVNDNPNVAAEVTYTITPTTNGCAGTPFTFTVTIPAVPVVTATAANAAICSDNPAGITMASNQTGTQYRWTANAPAGISSPTNLNQTALTTTAAITNTLINSTTAVITVTYTITPYNTAGCAGTPVTVSVDVSPRPTPANAGTDQELCGATSYVLQGNAPAPTETGRWTIVSGSGITFANDTDPHTTINGLTEGSTYVLKWTITTANGCTSEKTVTIRVLAPTVAGNTSPNTTVCRGENGTVTLTGYRGSILYWERSENSGANWVIVNNTNPTLPYTNIQVTTQFRAYVKNGNCGVLISPLTVVNVTIPPPQADAGPNQILCNQPTVNLVANNPGTFAGTWTQVSGPTANITSPNNYQTTVTGLTGANEYVFRWTIKANAPCVDTYDEVTITNRPDVVASFTADTKVGCGDLKVSFTNTSNNQTGANFIWNFGDGQTSINASPQHTFAQRTDGKDTTYYISLAVQGNCVQRPAIVDSILVRPAVPLARILPESTAGCGNYAIDIRNTTPGNNTLYEFYLYDGTTLVQKITKTDKINAVFDPISTTARKVFTVYMVATGYCNNTGETTHIPVSISPSNVVAQMVIQGGINAGCAPLNTTLVNNSFGGDNFYYSIYDANNNLVDRPVAGSTALPYRFTTPGTYYITITAISICGMNESPRTRIDVYATPTPNFVADITTGCKDALITFTNNTVSNAPNTPVTSLLYDWDFGDGSPHSALFAPTHGYHFTGTPYTVTLRATNTTSGCTEIFVRTAYINLYGPPKTAFDISPDSVTTIPNYTFSFIDRTPADAVSWQWTFGDGQTSTRRNPTVTYPDTGVYRVTLTTATANGCDSTITRTVRIGGVPGQLFLPNAFMPESATTELRTFMAKGSGIKTWHLQIFNNYGQLVWQTTKLSPKGEPEEGWDGTFKGVPLPQGVYQWQASATFINGTEWKGNSYKDELPKRVGSVHLIK
ncbi:hypothetical protein GCM10027049_22920 [Mucilaginibacter puniceus]